MSKRIRVQFGVTKNLGSYESARFDAAYEADVEEGQTVEEAYETAWSVVDGQIADQLNNLEG